jgi:hypothetical protein
LLQSGLRRCIIPDEGPLAFLENRAAGAIPYAAPLILISNRNISFSTDFFAQGVVVVLDGRRPAFVRRLAPHKKSSPIKAFY